MKILFLILVLVATTGWIFKTGGMAGIASSLIYAVCFFGLLGLGALALHYWGPNGESIYYCGMMAGAFSVCIVRWRKRKQRDLHKHHTKTRVDHVA
jgi:hypothetical protein